MVVGEKTLAKGSVEFKLRREQEARLVPLAEVVEKAKKELGL
jgi:threonyl-tRNA synthetase